MNARFRSPQAGLSLIELMVALTIGLLIFAGLATLFANASSSQHELRRTSQQIENGRYAMDVLIQDLQLAGYFGEYRASGTPTTPNPCSTATGELNNGVTLPIQGYNAGSLTALPTPNSACDPWLEDNLAAGSDILIVRRAETSIVPIGTTTSANSRYIQSGPTGFEVQAGGGTTTCTSKANGGGVAITRRCQFPTTTDICGGAGLPCAIGGSPAGYIRKLRAHIYFVSPCNQPASGTTCSAAADGGRPIPTLKRLELAEVGGALTFQTIALAEGVEFMKIAYGIDDLPAAVNSETGRIGDGVPDRYVLNPTLAEYSNAVTVRVDLLVRNPEPSPGFTEAKTYKLSVDPTAPANPGVTITPADLDKNYRRHAYTAEVRLVNMAGRKEIP
jgi:type IV pilus assembly protein PilW